MAFFSRLFFVLSIFTWSAHSYAEADYTLTITEVSVQETRADGKPWDVGLGDMAQPDLHLTMTVNGKSVLAQSFAKNKPRIIKHVTSSSFNINQTGAKVHIEVFDRDLNESDLIGALDFEINQNQVDQVITHHNDMILKFNVRLSLTRAGEAVLAQKRAQQEAQTALEAKEQAEEKARTEAEAKLKAEEQAQAAEAKAKAEAEAKEAAEKKAQGLEQKMKVVKEVLLQDKKSEE